jgi:hypothetical protein
MTYIDSLFSEIKCLTVFATLITWYEFAGSLTNSNSSVNFSEWNYYFANNSQQLNDYDSGFYLFRSFESYCNNKSMVWSAESFFEYRSLVLHRLVFFYININFVKLTTDIVIIIAKYAFH